MRQYAPVDLTTRARELILKTIEERKIKIGTLARESNVDSGSMWRFLHGQAQQPTFETVMKIFKYLQVNPMEICIQQHEEKS